MRNCFIRSVVLICCLCAVMALAACGSDRPPTDGTPAPAALNGRFVSEYGTLTFTGDGRSITIDCTGELSEKAGLPSGKQDGSYVFLFHHGEWRYDKAETFRIMLGDQSYSFQNALGITDEHTVAFMLPDTEIIAFEKTGE